MNVWHDLIFAAIEESRLIRLAQWSRRESLGDAVVRGAARGVGLVVRGRHQLVEHSDRRGGDAGHVVGGGRLRGKVPRACQCHLDVVATPHQGKPQVHGE